jgi:GAF domain-containing protein/HAMP domain-containing protein
MSSFIEFFIDESSESRSGQANTLGHISLGGSITAWLLFPVLLLAWAYTGDSQYQSLASIDIILAISLTAAYFLARFRIRWIPSWLTAISVAAALVAASFYITGLGIILAVIILVVVFSVAPQELPRQQALSMILIGLVAAGLGVVVDRFGLAPGTIEAPSWTQQGAVVLAGTLTLLISVSVTQSLQFSSTRMQLLLALLAIAVIPLITILASSFLTQSQHLKDIENQQLASTSRMLAGEMDSHLLALIAQTQNHARLPDVIKYLSNQENDLSNTLQAISNQDPFILAYGVVNMEGVTLLDVRAFRIGENNAETPWFVEAVTQQTGYVSNVFYDENLVRPVFYVSAPVFNDAQEVIGVMRAQYDVEHLRTFLLGRTNSLGTNATAILVDENGIILAHTTQANLHLKTLSQLDGETLSALQAARQLPAGTAESISAELSGLAAALATSEAGKVVYAPIAEDATRDASIVYAPMTRKSWRVLSSQAGPVYVFEALEENFSPLLIAIILLSTILVVAAVNSRLITAPLAHLAQVASDVGKGNWAVSANLKRSDELGSVARVFNSVTSQLRVLTQAIEEQVTQRTQELGEVNAFVSKKADQLKTVASVARTISDVKSLQILLPQVAEEVSKSFGYYHTGIFLIDPSGQFAVLQATNSEGGKKMLARGFRQRVGQVGIIGYVTAVGRARIALDVGEDATFFNYADLPTTRSEIALPLKSGSTILGVLNLQSEEPAAFSQNDIETLSLLADQISILIQNARLHDETQLALSEAQSIFSKTVQSSWNEIIEGEKGMFQFVNGQIKEVSHLPEDGQDAEGALEMPILIRGERLGKLNIKTSVQREWTEQEMRIFQSIVDRVGFALENARLFRDAQRLVSKERVIGEISDKISRSVDLDNILQTAVEELGQVISDSEVTIQFGEQESLES